MMNRPEQGYVLGYTGSWMETYSISSSTHEVLHPVAQSRARSLSQNPPEKWQRLFPK